MAVDTTPVRRALPARPTHDRPLVVAGSLAVLLAAVLIGALHVFVPELDPSWTMISDYALGPYRPVFDVAVLSLAAGSGVVLLVLIRSGLLRDAPITVALLATWCVAMLLVMAFPTCVCQVEVTPAGLVHAFASMTGFLVLPLAALRLSRRWRAHPAWFGFAVGVRALAVVALAGPAPMFLALVPVAEIAAPLWGIVPFGLIERILVGTEVVLLLVLGRWAGDAARLPQPSDKGS